MESEREMVDRPNVKDLSPGDMISWLTHEVEEDPNIVLGIFPDFPYLCTNLFVLVPSGRIIESYSMDDELVWRLTG